MNRDTLLAAVGGREKLLRAMARLCLEEDAPRLLAQLHRAADAGDPAELEAAAHGLKGLVAEFRAERATQAARALEAAAHHFPTTDLRPEIATFVREFDAFAVTLRTVLADPEP